MPEIGYRKFRAGDGHFVYDTTTNSLVRLPRLAWEILDTFLAGGQEDLLQPTFGDAGPDELREALSFLVEARTERGMFQPYQPRSFDGGLTLDAVEEALETGLSALGLNLTDQCNQRCTYCVYSGTYSSERTHGTRHMDWEVARQGVDYYLDRADPNSRPAITYYGGEPMLNWDVLQRVTAYLRKERQSQDPDIDVATNLTLLTRERLRFLKDHRVRIQLSIDGPQTVHDAGRIFPNGKGTYHTVMDRLSLIREMDPDYYRSSVSVVCTMDKRTDPVEIVRFLTENDLVKDLPVSFGALRESEIDGITVPWEVQALHSRRMDELLARYAREMAESHSPTYHRTFHNLFWLVFTTMVTRVPGLAGQTLPPNAACIPGVARLFVSTDGRLYTCEKFDVDPHSIGDIETGVDPRKSYRLLRDFSDWCNELCRECWAHRLCTQCFLQALEGGQVSKEQKRRSCMQTREEIAKGLERFAFLWQEEPPSVHGEDFSLHETVRKARSAH